MIFGKNPIWDAEDCALIIIDYQEEMFHRMRSSSRELVEFNIAMLARSARAFGVPVILSTVGVESGMNKPTIESLRTELPGVKEIDRTTMNAWEDKEFLKAVKETDKKRLIFCALWTEICLAFPVVSALKDDFEVAIVIDAIGGESEDEHKAAISRMIHAGAIPSTTTATITEWFRDWASERGSTGRDLIMPYLQAKEKFYPEFHLREQSRPEKSGETSWPTSPH